jgi:Icc-related predicted phosphoesterase
MKLKLISDIHLEYLTEYKDNYLNLDEGNILVLAGNILITKHFRTDNKMKDIYLNFFEDCTKRYDKILYVLGNNEHYGYHLDNTYNTLLEYLPNSVKLLENEKVIFNNWVFIGMTMWTDFNNKNKLNMSASKQILNDYQLIRIESNYRKLHPEDVIKINSQSKKYLNKELKRHKTDNIFLITHHPPSKQSIPETYENNLLTSSNYSDMSKIIKRNPQIKYWAHGHINVESDYNIDNCRIVSSCSNKNFILE